MQQDADFITADFLYMFQASCAHPQNCKILTLHPPVQVVMVAGGSSLHHIRDETVSFRLRYTLQRKDRIKDEFSVASIKILKSEEVNLKTDKECRN